MIVERWAGPVNALTSQSRSSNRESPFARKEARILFAMLGRNGDAVNSIRELRAVAPESGAALTGYARKYPEDAAGIERMLRFCRCMGEEFEQPVLSR